MFRRALCTRVPVRATSARFVPAASRRLAFPVRHFATATEIARRGAFTRLITAHICEQTKTSTSGSIRRRRALQELKLWSPSSMLWSIGLAKVRSCRYHLKLVVRFNVADDVRFGVLRRRNDALWRQVITIWRS